MATSRTRSSKTAGRTRSSTVRRASKAKRFGPPPKTAPKNRSTSGKVLGRSLSLGSIMIQNQILEMIAQGKKLKTVLDTLARLIEKHSSPCKNVIFLLDQERQTLYPHSAPSLPASFMKLLDGIPVGPTSGSCGSAVFKNRLVIVEDVSKDPRTRPLASSMKKQGLLACFSIPIHNARREPLGTLCLFLPENRKPGAEEKEILQTASRLAGIAVERHQAEKEMEVIRSRLEEQVQEQTHTMMEAIRQLQDEIVQRKKMERSLKESNEKLQNLTNHQESVREEERQRISREIHDELGQILTTLKMELSLLDDRSREENLPIQEDLRSMTSLVETTLHTVRRISTELRPGILDVLGLAEALEWQAQEFQKRTHIPVKTEIQRLPEQATGRFATACFRICQEALTNVARHARASRITLSLKERKNRLELKVQDNGCGITPEQASRMTSLGLIGMRERAQNLGGTLEIKPGPKKGTLVHASFPLDSRA